MVFGASLCRRWILTLPRRAAARGEAPRVPADRRAARRLQDDAVRRERGRRRVSQKHPGAKIPSRRLFHPDYPGPEPHPAPTISENPLRSPFPQTPTFSVATGDSVFPLNNSEPNAAIPG